MKDLIIKYGRLSKVNLLVYVLVCTVGVVIAFYPTLQSGFLSSQTDPGDSWLVNYFLEHSFQILVNRKYRGDLWSPIFFYPYKNVLAFSENLFGSAPVYWLFRSFFTSDLAFQLWMIAVCVLNFFSFAFLMRKYQVGHILSALGAFIFTFSMPRIVQLGHQQLLPQFFTPFVFLTGWEFVKQPTRKRLTLLLLLTYLQVLAGIYLGWFLLFSLLIFFVITYGLYSAARIKFLTYWHSNYIATITITLGWLGLTILTLFPYLQAKSVLGARTYSEVDTMLPRISSWFSVVPGSLWSSLLGWTSKDLPMVNEHFMFAGFTIILLTALSIYVLLYGKNILTPERAWIVKICLLVFISLFCLSLRLPVGLSLWRVVYEIVPGASVIRGVTRIWTISYFYLLIAVLISFDSLLHAVVAAKRSRLVIVTILCLIGVSEQLVLDLPSYKKEPYIKQVSELHKLMNKNCDVAYLSLNPETAFYVYHLSAMWAGIETNVPVVNGYSGNEPPRYVDSTKSMNIAQVVNWLESFSTSDKRLCMISQTSLEKQDSLLKYAVQKNTSLSGKFVSHAIPLPLPKVFAQEIKFFEVPQTVEPTTTIKMPVFVKNTSNFLWSPEGEYPTNFSYRWIDSNGNLAIFDGDGDRTVIPSTLSPGESAALIAAIRTPSTPGKYKLILTMVQEAVAWFSDQGINSPEIPLEVISR